MCLGIDFDWVSFYTLGSVKYLSLRQEFPNNAGAGQPFSSKDTANLLLVFKALRVSLGQFFSSTVERI